MNYIKSLLFFTVFAFQITNTAVETLEQEQEKLRDYSVELVNQSKGKVEITGITGWIQGIATEDSLMPGDKKNIKIKPGTRFMVNFIAEKPIEPAQEAAKIAAKKWWQLWKSGSSKPENMIASSYLLTFDKQTKNAKASQVTFGAKPRLSWLFPFPVYASGVAVAIQNVSVSAPVSIEKAAEQASERAIESGSGSSLPAGE